MKIIQIKQIHTVYNCVTVCEQKAMLENLKLSRGDKMKILRVLGLIFFLVAAVFMPVALFSDGNVKLIIGLIGSLSLGVGAIIYLIVTILYKKRSDKNRSDK